MKKFSVKELREHNNEYKLRLYSVPTNYPMYCVIKDDDVVGYVDYKQFEKLVDYTTKKWYYSFETFNIKGE